MICIIAFVVFGILGIFSAGYRKIAKEAFDCVFRRVTFRKCTTGLDKRLKSQITGKLIKKNPKIAKFVYKRFEILSWVFTILLIASVAYSAYGLYNYAVYGNCNGDTGGFCIYDVFTHSEQEVAVCGAPIDPLEIIRPDVKGRNYFGPADAELEIIEFGCFSCHYTRKAQPAVERIIEEYGDRIKFYFIHFPIPSHENSGEAAIASECARIQGSFWSYYSQLFRTRDMNNEEFVSIGKEIGLNEEEFYSCLTDKRTGDAVDKDIALAEESGIYGTPTFFIGDQTFVGPLDYKDFKKIVEEELASQ